MSETADRDGNRALRERLSDVYGRYEQLRAHLDDLPQRLASMQVTVASPDGSVQATVGPRGQLIDLRIDHGSYRTVGADDLARTIVATAREAAERTAGGIEALLAGYLPPDSGTMHFLRDNDFASLMGRADSLMRVPGPGATAAPPAPAEPTPRPAADAPSSRPRPDTPGSRSRLDTPDSRTALDTPDSRTGLDTPDSRTGLDAPGSRPGSRTRGSGFRTDASALRPEPDTADSRFDD